MARTIRYYPHVKADWVRSFNVMTRWGFCMYVPMSDVIDNVGLIGSDKSISNSEDDPTKTKTLYEYQTIFHATDPVDKQPTLWVERNLGALMLRPKNFNYTYDNTELSSNHTWTGMTIPHTPGTITWEAPEAERNDIWKEETTPVFTKWVVGDSPKVPPYTTVTETKTQVKFLHMFNENTIDKVRNIKTTFDIVENGSFCIVVGLPAQVANQKQASSVVIGFGADTWKIKWSRDDRPQLLDQADNVLDTIRIPEGDTSIYNSIWAANNIKTYAFMVQWGFHSVIISNGIQIDYTQTEKEPKQARNWIYRVPTMSAATNGIKIPASPISVTFSGSDGYLAYIPVEYAENGTLKAGKSPIGYKPTTTKMTTNSIPGTVNDVTTTHGDTEVSKSFDIGDSEPFNYDWTVTLKRFDGDGTDQPNYTPLVFGVEFNGSPKYETAFLDSNDIPDIRSEDIMSCNLSEYVDQSRTCTLVVWNRGGRFKNLYGMYPIKVSIGQQTGAERIGDFDNAPTGVPTMYQHIFGFVSGIQYSRPDAAQSTVTLTITDRRIQVVEAIAVNLPIYDGWKHYEAIADLADRSGIETGDRVISGINELASSPLSPHNLPNSGLMKDPLYMFSAGTGMWECMEKIRQWSQWWLYFDHLGKLNYRDPVLTTVSSPTTFPNGRKFKEVPSTVNAYDELKRMDVEKRLSEIVNTIFVQGLDYNYPVPQPLFAIEKSPLAGTIDKSKMGWVPWNRFQIISDAALNNPGVVNAVAAETFKRASRPRFFIKFTAWGQPDLHPLNIIEIEELAKETGIMELTEPKKFRITAITHNLSKGGAEAYTCDIEGEWVDPQYTYDPYWS